MGKYNRVLLIKIGLGGVTLIFLCLAGMFVLSNNQTLQPNSKSFIQRVRNLIPALWTITPLTTATPEKVELIFDGKGEQEIRFMVEHGGIYVFATDHTGDGEFDVTIKDTFYKTVGTGAACEDDCADYRVVTLESGEYIMQIHTNGWWLILAQRISP